MSLWMLLSGQEAHEGPDNGKTHGTQWGQELPVGLDNPFDAVRPFVSKWPLPVVLVIRLSDEVRSDQSFEEVREV